MQRKPTRTSAIIASLAALGMVLTACGDSGDDADSGGKSSISIGQVGDYTGPVPDLDGQGIGLQAWVKSVNDAGGIDGHKIDLHTADAKGDPASEVSEVTKMVSQHDVVAFAGMGLTTLSGSAPFIAKEKIPVIGGNTSDVTWAVNPYFYNPGAGLIGAYLQGFFAVPPGKEKTGIVYCKESSGCTGVKTMMFDLGLSAGNGGDPVFQAEVSLSAPSFTAPCLAAKQAGVQTLAVALDGANIIRLAKDCAKQDFFPTYALGTNAVSAETGAAPELDGAVSGQLQALATSDVPEVANLTAAMEKYFPDDDIGAGVVMGWAAGLALGKAIENALAENPDDDVTSESILAGLGQIQDETFNGLTPPVTFTADGVQEQSLCAFSVTVKDGAWTPNGDAATCPPDSIKPVADAALAELAKPAS